MLKSRDGKMDLCWDEVRTRRALVRNSDVDAAMKSDGAGTCCERGSLGDLNRGWLAEEAPWMMDGWIEG